MMSLRAAGAAAMALLALLASVEGFTLPGAPACGAAPQRTVCLRGRRSAGGVVSMSGGLEDLQGKVLTPCLACVIVRVGKLDQLRLLGYSLYAPCVFVGMYA